MELGQAITPPHRQLPAGRVEQAVRRLLKPQPQFEIHDAASKSRPQLEAYVAEHFQRVYDARVSEFLPIMLSMRCQGHISAVVGLRPAGQGPLFLEQYLDQPIEAALTTLTGRPVARSEILEVGNLVATHRGACRLLFGLLAAIADQAGYRWGAFAATGRVARILAKLRVTVHPLANADAGRLEGDASRWGSYYNTDPKVLVVNIPEAVAALKESLFSCATMALFRGAVRELGRSLRMSAFQ